VKKSSRYKKEYAQSSSAWKKYFLVPFVAFSCGGLSVLGYYFFFKAPQQNVPTVEGYAVPARTYVAPQGEKTVQKIYDLDQSGERPIVEKILPSQDQPNTTTHPVQEAVSPKSTTPRSPEPPLKVEPQKNTLSPPLEKDDSLDLNMDAPPQKTPSPLSPVKPPQASDHKPKAAPASPLQHASSRRIQVGPVFNDFQQAKAFLARLQKTAKGYSFALQAREIQNVTRYRIVTQHALTPSQIQALTPLIPSSR
jgi:hypothetical protein